jgi:hypothetical protein
MQPINEIQPNSPFSNVNEKPSLKFQIQKNFVDFTKLIAGIKKLKASIKPLPNFKSGGIINELEDGEYIIKK